LGGIGKCYVQSLLKDGAKGISIWDVVDTQSESFLTELEAEFGKGKAIFLKVDLSDTKQIDEAYEKTVAHFDQLDIVVNNAGVIEEVDALKVASVNLVSVIHSTDLALFKYLPKYSKTGDASVINTGSIAGLAITDYVPAYGATKHAVIAYTRAIGSKGQFGFTKIRVMAICPGYTFTPITEQKIPEKFSRLVALGSKAEADKGQGPEVLGDALIKVLKEGKTGSIWLARGGVVKEFDFTASDESVAKQFDY